MRVTSTDTCSQPAEFTDIVGNGRWQLQLFFLITLGGLIPAWNHLAISFLAFPQDYRCTDPYVSNATVDGRWGDVPNTTLPFQNPCETQVQNGSVFATTTVQCSSWGFSPGYKSIIQEWELVCTNDWLISVSQSVYMIGFLIAAIFSGQMSDIYGRHPMIIFNVVVLLVAGFSAAFSPSFIVFVISRFFVALGNSGWNLTAYVLLVEVVGARYRAQCVLLSNFGFNFGYLLLPLMAWLLQDWFYLQLAITIPSLLLLSFYWLLPESPRWLLTANKLEKAIATMNHAALKNRRHVPDLERKVKMLHEQVASDHSATVLDLLRTPILRRNTLCLYFIWMSIAFTYYGLSLNTNELQGDHFWNFFLSGLMDIPGTIICMLTIDRYGRKKPFICTLMLGGVTCLCSIFMKEDWGLITTALALGGKLFVSASFILVYVYSAEIFPTVVRNVGVGSSSTVGRIGSSLAPFMRDLGNITYPAVPLALFGILSIISGIFVMLLPETGNCPIPETLNDAEKFLKARDNSGKRDADSSLSSHL